MEYNGEKGAKVKDLARIYVRAGDGGRGSVHFRREKFAPKGGPDGGDGGKGGSVIVVADENVESLIEFNFQKRFLAKNGENGRGKRMHGADMPDVIVRVPVGTVLWEIPPEYFEADLRRREIFAQMINKRHIVMDMKKHGERCVVAFGGKGGRGNWHFRSATNQAPMEFEEGEKGEEKYLLLELKVVAQVGIVGLPNAGKSSLLKALTRANPKIAGYPFTTLEPNLGVLSFGDKRKILVDVPGVVEEAWEGKGIGPWFLRHLERCEKLIHVLAPDEGGRVLAGDELLAKLAKDYWVVRKELEKYGNGLPQKEEVIVMNKRELIAKEEWERIREAMKKENKREVLLVSAASTEGLEQLKERVG